MLNQLKEFHDKGLALILLRSKSKQPFEPSWQRGPRKTWEELEHSYKGGMNFGVRLGTASQLADGSFLAVIDCDVKSKDKKHVHELLTELKKIKGLGSNAPEVQSGRGNGSRHVYFKSSAPIQSFTLLKSSDLVEVHMPSVRPSEKDKKLLTPEKIEAGYRSRPAWEISIMGEGKQVVLPPSVHPDSGLRYKWHKEFKIEKLPLIDFEKPEKKMATGETITGDGVDLIEIDIALTGLSNRIVNMILRGDDCEDRSAGLMSAAIAMASEGLSDGEILWVLTNPDFYLGAVAYDHTGSNDRGRAAKWVKRYTLDRARFEVSAEKTFADEVIVDEVMTDDEALKLSSEMIDKSILPDRTKEGKPKVTLKNVLHILENFVGVGFLALNEFTNRLVFQEATEYGAQKHEFLSDKHDLLLKKWIARNYGFEPNAQLCFEAHNLIAENNRFHPPREWLSGLKWDGVSRADHWLEKGLGAINESGAYLSEVGRKTLCGAVARLLSPGIKFDYVLVLEGEQGRGKSTALATLAGPEWFSDNLGDIHQKDVVDNMAGKWIIELSELASIKKADVDTLKSFITRQVDRVRLPYGRRSEDYPRQCVFIGTTNLTEYFFDETGNRRFWPVRTSDIDLKWLKENRDQLFAEARDLWTLGEDLYLSKEIEAVAKATQSERYSEDEWREPVEHFLRESEAEYFNLLEVMNGALGRIGSDISENDTRRLGKIMRRLGYERRIFKRNKKVFRAWKKNSRGL